MCTRRQPLLLLLSLAAAGLLACASSAPKVDDPLFGDGTSMIPPDRQRLFASCDYELFQQDSYDQDNWRNCRGTSRVRMFEHRWYDENYNAKAAIKEIEQAWMKAGPERKVLSWDKLNVGGESLDRERVRYDVGGPGSVVTTYVTTDDGHVYVCQVDAYVGARPKTPDEMNRDQRDCEDGIAAMHSVVSGH